MRIISEYMKRPLTKFHLLQRLYIGLYSVYISDWLKVFPRDQLMFLRLEDWHSGCTEILPTVFNFLGLGKF